MDYYGFGLVGSYADAPHALAINDHLELVERADELGLDGWYFAEHHGHAEFSLSPAPNLFTAAVARRTSRLRFGNMVTILPFSHPVRVAEEIRLLDVLTGGRFEMGFGRGQVRDEQAMFGIDRDSTVDMFDEAFSIVQRLLAGETVDHSSPWWSGTGARLVPDPTGAPIPLWISAASPESVEKCARLGVNCATALLTRKFADERLAAFRDAWAEHQPDRPGEGMFAISATVAVGESEAEALRHVRHDIEAKQRHFALAISDVPRADDRTYASHKPAYDAFSTSTVDSMLEDGLLIAGTVEQCRDQVAEIHRRGVDRLICVFHTAQSDFAFSRRSMELFLTEVVPTVEVLATR